MRVALITAGAAGMICGSCLNDNTLVRALRDLGHDAQLIPTYTPITTDGPEATTSRVFMGGIRIYLEEKYPWFCNMPRWMTSWLDAKPLLRMAGKFAGSSDYSSLGNLTLSLLSGENGPHRHDMASLCDYLARESRPEIMHMSNALISGILPMIAKRLSAPIIVELQGDDIFLDGLKPQHKLLAIKAIRENTKNVARFHTPCVDYADYMAGYLGIDRSRFHVVPLGIDLGAYQTPPKSHKGGAPVLGYFARMCPEKGLDLLLDAWLLLRNKPDFGTLKLQVGGYLGKAHQSYWKALQKKVHDAGHADGLVHRPCATTVEKSAFFADCDLFSVPARMREPKGIYLLEAWAHGLSVIGPQYGSFPELISHTGGGILFERENVVKLAEAIESLLKDPNQAGEMGQKAKRIVGERFTSENMARATLASYSEVLASYSEVLASSSEVLASSSEVLA